jgi:hypothetical protein
MPASRPNAFEERVIATLAKNTVTEQRLTVKSTVARGATDRVPFIEIREFWYKNMLEEPLHTRKGTMIHRKHIGVVMLALAREMNAGELSDIADELKAAINRATGEADPVATAVAMLKRLSNEQVDEVMTKV